MDIVSQLTTLIADASRPSGEPITDPAIERTGRGQLSSCFAVSDLAECTVAAAASALAGYCQKIAYPMGQLSVDRRLASLWFSSSYKPVGWTAPSPWDDIAGHYRTRDGWIQLHTNAAHHCSSALAVLACRKDKREVEAAVAQWRATELEQAIDNAGGCAATFRSPIEWAEHPQGLAVRQEPLIAWRQLGQVQDFAPVTAVANGPLAGVRVLDLTRIIAGPVSTRFLAAFGAEVLRIDPPDWQEKTLVAEMTAGKRCATLDLKTSAGQEQLKQLLVDADVIVHGYRPDALVKLGFDTDFLSALNPSLINVALCAYGWTGPWRHRRGFDSLVQTGSGIAWYGMEASGADRPVPLPVQALDHATGYLLAASVLNALTERLVSGKVYQARLSLAATGMLLQQFQQNWPTSGIIERARDEEYNEVPEHTPWGQLLRLRFPVTSAGYTPHWPYPANNLHSAEPNWPISIKGTVS